ncbi:MAG: hybrid sensor histidine kinase/response regulator [Candidatus Eiseniibacteriota bacterium]
MRDRKPLTERRRAENTLQRSERDLFELFEHANVGLHWAAPDGTILRANETELALLGCARDEYVGRNIAEFHVDPLVIQEILERLERGETLREHPAQMCRKDGSIRDVLISANMLFEGGKLIHIRRLTRDVTDARKAHETRELLSSIVQSSDDAIVSKTLEGIVLTWNSGAQRLFGYKPEEIVGRPITLIIPEELHEEERSILARLRRGERIDHYETVRVSKAGRRIDVSLTVSPIRDPSGRIIGASKVARDISCRKAAAEQIRESETRFRAFADSAPVLIWLNDPTGCIFVNRAYLDFVGVPHLVDVRGYNWAEFIHPEDRDAYVALYLDCQERRVPFTAEFRFRRHDGQYRWMHSSGVARISSSGAYLGYTGCTMDIHEVRMASEALHEADRLKNEFLATLAHELRNPLAPLANMLEVMKRADHDSELLVQARGTMERQLASLVRLVDDLIDLSRITRNKLELRRERVDLADVIRQAVETCTPLLEGFHHELTVTLPPETIFVHADRERLAQVFTNLLNNACKYTEPEGRLSLSATRRGMEVVVSVKDNGIGIPKEKLAGVFDMFTQVDQTFERTQGGLGVGLSLVRRLVEMHDGTVSATSEGSGRGSEFVVRLPLEIPALPAAEAPRVLVEKRAAPRRILVVDDNQDSAASLALLLSVTGEETLMAHDGMAAVEAAEQFRPGVVLLDLGLPRLNGFDAARSIREQPWGKDMILIALTGWGQEEDRRKSQAAGFDAHLVKPVDYDALMKLLASLPAATQAT